MKKTFCLMFLIVFCCMAIVGVSLTTPVFAEEKANNINLNNPVGSCANADASAIYIADNDISNKGVVYLLTNGAVTAKNYTKKIVKIRYSVNSLYILYDTKELFSYVGETTKLIADNINDFDVNDTYYTLATDLAVKRYSLDGKDEMTKNVSSCQAVAIGNDNRIHYLSDNIITTIKENWSEEANTINLATGNNTISTANNQLYQYNNADTDVYFKAIGDTIAYVTAKTAKEVTKNTFIDNIFTVTDLIIYNDKVDLDVPFDVFTATLGDTPTSVVQLATVVGYPSCTVYSAVKIVDQTIKLSGTLDVGAQVLILGEVKDYYYILFEGKVGFIKKSDKVVITQTTIDTAAPTMYCQYASITTYRLPCFKTISLDNNDTAVNYKKQTFGSMIKPDAINKEFKVLYVFTYEKNEIAYVEYTDGETTKYGFVLYGDLRNTKREEDAGTKVERLLRVANPEIGDVVNIYSYADTTSSVVYSLRSGDKIDAYDITGQFFYVEYTIGETTHSGYVVKTQTIDEYGLTNYATLGLVCAIFVILLATYITIMLVRRKKLKAKQDDLNNKDNE